MDYRPGSRKLRGDPHVAATSWNLRRLPRVSYVFQAQAKRAGNVDALCSRGIAPVKARCCERDVTMELRWYFDGISTDLRWIWALFALPTAPLALPIRGEPSPPHILVLWC